MFVCRRVAKQGIVVVLDRELLVWFTRNPGWLVCYLSEGSVSVPFSVSLELQFADNLKSIQIETMTYGKINWRNTSFNISSISRRLPPSSNALGSINYFNWFIHYHVTELSRGGGTLLSGYGYYTPHCWFCSP